MMMDCITWCAQRETLHARTHRQNTCRAHVSAINNYTDTNTNTLHSQFVLFTRAVYLAELPLHCTLLTTPSSHATLSSLSAPATSHRLERHHIQICTTEIYHYTLIFDAIKRSTLSTFNSPTPPLSSKKIDCAWSECPTCLTILRALFFPPAFSTNSFSQEYLGVGGRIILTCMLMKQGKRVWTGMRWIKVRWSFKLHHRHGIWLDARRWASQEGFYSSEFGENCISGKIKFPFMYSTWHLSF